MGARKWLGLASLVTAVALCGCQGGPSGSTARNGSQTPMAGWNNRPTGPGMAGSSTAPGTGGMTPIGTPGGVNGFRTPGAANPNVGAMVPATSGAHFSGPAPFPQDPQGFHPGATTTTRTTFPGAPAMPSGAGLQPMPGSPAMPPPVGNPPAHFGGPSVPPAPSFPLR